MVSTLPTVILLDDEVSARESIHTVLTGAGFRVVSTATMDEFLHKVGEESADCLLVDYRLGDATALDVLESVRRVDAAPPIIVITGAGDVTTAVQAMRAGAADYFTKPLNHGELIERIRRAVEETAVTRREIAEMAAVASRLESLTPRERDVLRRVVAGKVTKEIASELGISPKTVEVHRSHLTRKMKVRSVAELVRLVTKYELNQKQHRGSAD